VPPLPRLRIAALADVARQLRFAPRETVRRQLERAQALAEEIDPGVNYPEDWLVFRITGYRASIEAPATFVGSALLGDLSALVERLSAGAGLSWAELEPGRYLAVEELLARWHVSRKTLERRRRQGLITLRARGANGKIRLVFPASSVERFESRHAGAVESAAAFTRIDAAARARILRRAAAYRRRLGWTLDRAARRLAVRFGRARETIRQLLIRHDGIASEPIFARRGRVSLREGRLIERAARLAIEPGMVADRLGRSRASVLRFMRNRRAERLRGLGLEAWSMGRPGAVSAAALGGIGAPGPTDLMEMFEAARATSPPNAATERALATAYRGLVGRAARAIAGLPRHSPSPRVLDRIETDLRTAARVKAELVRSQLPLLARTIESGLGRRPEELRAGLLGPLVDEALAAICLAVDVFDAGSTRGGRLAAPAGLALTRAVSGWCRTHEAELRATAGRATPRLGPGTPLADFTTRVSPWQQFLDPPPAVRVALARLPARERDFLRARFGWPGAAHTLAELAAQARTTIIKAALLERRALRAARRGGNHG
jgi:RNA polymerase primary sigma factor